MTPQNSRDWSFHSEEDQLAIARRASRAEIRRMARRYDWSQHPEATLSWIMAHKGMDLSSAITVFLNGDPERFNYLSKRDVPQEYLGAARVLDNICLRINSGFYLLREGQMIEGKTRLERWLMYQQADRLEGRRGRWILDETIIESALHRNPQIQCEQDVTFEAIRSDRQPGAVRGILAELMDGGLGRRLEKYLPRRG